METMMQTPEMQDRLSKVGLEVDYRRAEPFADDLKVQRERFTEIIRRGNIKLE
jgi:tripartite-type tricarboxylate transporter receptor subunit TctC